MKHKAWVLVLLAACQRVPARAEPTRGTSTAPTTSSPRSDARAALDDLDTRAALPLLPFMANHQKQNMRDHLLAVQEIIAALAVDDFAGAEQAAKRMGYSDSMAQMCTHMGAGAAGFTERALAFHHTADTIAAAARNHDRSAVIGALGATLNTCTGCHAAFKQAVVDEATWNHLAATNPSTRASMRSPAP